LACVALILSLDGGGRPYAPTAEQPEGPSGREQETISIRHLVVAANPLAAAAGRQMLRDGGSAVDAAIAVQLVLNLVEPQSSGI
jgi:gamma-glutamyltranspeptidase / glutathione hydrolase